MLLKSHFFWRTFLGYVVVALIGTFLFAASLIKFSAEKARQEAGSTLRLTAELLAVAVTSPIRNLNYPAIRELTTSVSEYSSLRITFIDSNGVVLADSHEDPFRMDNHLRRPEILAARNFGIGRSQRYSFTLEENFTYLSLPVYSQINSQGQVIGFARAAISAEKLSGEIQQAQTIILRNSAIATFFILLLAFYLAARQSAKIDQLTSVAEEISQGNFARRIPEGNSLGLKKMAEAINQMARSSAKSVSEITSDRNRLSMIFTCMVEGVIDVDLEQKILHINEAAARLLSVNQKACLGKPLWQEIRNQEIINALDEAIRTNSVIKTQVQLLQPSGDFIVDVYAATLNDDEGQPSGAVLVLHDITDLKNLERVRTDFVANASHELKTPITAIRGISETILGDEDVEKDTLKHFIERVHAQSLRLSQLVGDLMTISRLEGSQGKDDFTKINFADLVRQSVKTAQPSAEEKGHKLIAEISDQDLILYGDRQNLCQLVDNLLDNALKYTPEEGVITVNLRKEDNEAVLDVTDTGIGLSPQYQSRIFERFYRVDKVRSQSLGGTGLGLSIVKNIAEKHGGSVGVKSQIGKGSTFTFRVQLNSSGPA